MTGLTEKIQTLIGDDNLGEDPEALIQRVRGVRVVLSDAEERLNDSDPEWAVTQEILIDKLIPLRKKLLSMKRDEVLSEVIDLLADYGVTKSIDKAVQLKKEALAVFAQCSSAKCKQSALDMLIKIFKCYPGSENATKLDAFGVKKQMISAVVQPSKYSPSVLKSVNMCLGSLIRSYPDEMKEDENTIFYYLMGQMDTQTDSKVKQVQLPLLEGCLSALNDYLSSFAIQEDDVEKKEKIYEKLKRLCQKPPTEVMARRTTMRLAVDLFADHSMCFADFIVGDIKFWNSTLTDWAFSPNRDDHKIGWKAIVSFYKTAGHQLGQEKNEKAFNFLLREITTVVNKTSSDTKSFSLAIQAYGHLAKAVKREKSAEEVSKMLLVLLQKTEEMFFGAEDPNEVSFEDKNLHLSTYIEALTNIMAEVNVVSPACSMAFEKLLVHKIIKFPHLPKQYHIFAVKAMQGALRLMETNKVEFHSDGLSNVIYQGIINSCSYPVITKKDEEVISFTNEKVTSVKSFFPFWVGILGHIENQLVSSLVDAFVTSIIVILEKLDFSVCEDEAQATMEDEDDDDSMKNLHFKAKDFTVMANVESLFNTFMNASGYRHLFKWIAPLGLALITKMNKFPQVSSLYRSFKIVLGAASEVKWFSTSEDTDGTFQSFLHFMKISLKQSTTFEDDLQTSTLELALEMPLEMASNLVESLFKPLERVFTDQPLSVVRKGIAFLTRLQSDLQKDKFHQLMKMLMPKLKKFCGVRKVEAVEGSTETVTTKRQGRGKRSKANQTFQKQEEDIQNEVLLFLGSLDFQLLVDLVPSKEELGSRVTIPDLDQGQLHFGVPFQDQFVQVSLDKILPRILHLCHSSNDRKGRVASCEFLHVYAIFLIGKSVSRTREMESQKPLASYFEQIFPVMIKLSADSDVVIRELFHPLLHQVVHWFTRPRENEAPETMALLDSILEGLCDESDALLRKNCAKLLSEFLKWSIKQIPPAKMKSICFNPKAVFNRLGALWLHPDPVRRCGASLAFNQCYKRFREEAELVSAFSIEICVNILKSMKVGDQDLVDFGSQVEAEQALKHILRILREKSRVFEAPEESRKDLEGLKAQTLDGLCLWLLEMSLATETGLRRSSINAINELTALKRREKAVSQLCQKKRVTQEELVQELDSKITHNFDDMASLRTFLATLESLSWLLESNALQCHINASFIPNLVKAVQLFAKDASKASASTLNDMDKAMIRCTIALRITSFGLFLARSGQHDLAKLIWTPVMWDMVVLMTFSPSNFGFDVRSKDIASGLYQCLKTVFETCQRSQHFMGKCFPDLNEPINDLIERANKGEQSQDIREGFQGVATLSKSCLVKIDPKLLMQTITSKKTLVPEFFDVFDQFVKESGEGLVFVCNAYFTKTLCEEGMKYVVKKAIDYPEVIITAAIEQFSTDPQMSISFALKVLKYHLSIKDSVKTASKKLFAMLETFWSSLETFSNQNPDNFMSALATLRLLLANGAPPINSYKTWLLASLTNRDLPLKIKSSVVNLLSYFMTYDEDTVITEALEKMSMMNFPLMTQELTKSANDAKLKEYQNMFQSLLQVLKSTANDGLLTFMALIVSREDDHICSAQWESCLTTLLQSRSKNVQLKLISSIYHLYAEDPRSNHDMKLKILSCTLCPLLCGARPLAINDFYIQIIKDIVEGLETNLFGSDEAIKTNLVRRIGSCKLLAVMYGGLSREMVHSSSSVISKTAYAHLQSKGLAKSGSDGGTDLAKYLLPKFQSLRSESIDGSDELRELFRAFQCCAFNAVMSLITCLQDREAFYSNYIFSETPSKRQFIWTRIIDLDKVYNFPLEVEKLGERRKDIVSIRKSKKAQERDSSSAGSSLQTMASHYLNDSSLSQDITSFDYNQSIVYATSATAPVQTEEASDSLESHNEISLENDDLNQHECMAPLIAVIDLMRDNGIYKTPKSDDERMPDWMDCLISKLKDESVAKNVRFFILKLICNRPDTFKPFAKHCGLDILRLVVSEELWSEMDAVNTLRLDLVAIILSWSEHFVPSSSVIEKSLAGSLMDYLVDSCCKVSHRDLLKYLVELIRTMSGAWGSTCLLNPPISLISTKMAELQSARAGVSLNALIQIVGAWLQHSLPLTASSSAKRLWERLCDLIQLDQKQIANQAAEVLGMALKVYRNDQSSFQSLKDQVQNKLSSMARGQSAREKAKFIDILHCIFKHYPDIVKDFVKTFHFDLKRFSGSALTQCLEMLGAITDVLAESEDGLGRELSMLNVQDFLNHFDFANQIATLELLMKLAPQMDSAIMTEYLDFLDQLCFHSSFNVRSKNYDVLKAFYQSLKTKPTHAPSDIDVKTKSLAFLTRGFEDEEASIVLSIFEFFNKEDHLAETVETRLWQLFSLVLNSESQNSFLSVAGPLLLALTEKSPMLEQKIYKEPLNSATVFRQQHIDTSWRSQTQSSKTPKFVETLATVTQGYTQGSFAGYVRATQTSLEFDPTQNEEQSTQDGLSATQLYVQQHKQGAGFGSQALGQDEIQREANTRPLIGRRFVKSDSGDREKAKAQFARAHARKEDQLKRTEEDRRQKRFEQVTLKRQYRIGELPDIEITNADVVRPLANLCKYDDHIGLLFLKMLSVELKAMAKGPSFASDMEVALTKAVADIDFSHRMTAETVLEHCLIFDSGSISLDRVLVQCKSLQLEAHGITLVQNRLISPPTDSAQPEQKRKRTTEEGNESLWLKLLDLFRHVGDQDSVRGAAKQGFLEKSDLGTALSYESGGRWDMATKEYEQLIKTYKQNDDQELSQFLTEAYYSSMEKMSDWNELSKKMSSANDTSKPGLIPKLIRAEAHRMINGQDSGNALKRIFTDGNLSEQWLRNNFGLELTLFFTKGGKTDKAKLALAKFASHFLTVWSSQNEFHTNQVHRNLSILKRIAIAHQHLNSTPRVFDAKGDLSYFWNIQDGEDVFRDLRGFAELTRIDDDIQMENTALLLDLAQEANNRNQHLVSTNTLRLVKKRLELIPNESSLHEKYHVMYADTVALHLKAMNTTSLEKVKTLHRYIMNVDEEGLSECYVTTKMKLFDCLDTFLKDMESVEKVSNILEILKKPEQKEHFCQLAMGCDSVGELRKSIALKSAAMLQDLSVTGPPSSWQLAELGYKLVLEFEDPTSIDLVTSAHIKAISNNVNRARQLFPNLLSLLQDKATLKQKKKFEDALEGLDTWLLLPWAGQLLSELFQDQLGPQLRPFMLKMASDYPQALRYPYFFSKEASGTTETNEMDHILKPPEVVEKLVHGLSHVAVPEVLLLDELSPFKSSTSKLLEKAKEVKANFEKISGKELKASVKKWLANLSSGSELSKSLDDIRRHKGRRNRSTALSDYVPFLHDFHSGNYTDYFEIPGQYESYQKPDPDRHVKLLCFGSKLRIFSSIRMPINITMIGDNGKKYSFIVKCGEDLRQDERIQKLFQISNKSFQCHSQLGQIQTYVVAPITKKVGLIGCVPKTCPYSALAKPKNKIVVGANELCDNATTFETLASQSSETRSSQYEALLAQNSALCLKNSFLSLANSAEGYFFFKNNFISSHALHSIVGWLLSIGDRHADNFLVSLVTGESIVIDFGMSFGVAMFLPIPELVPFRMTPQIQSLVAPLTNQGPIRELMIQALDCLKRDNSVFVAALNIFIREPTVDWLDFAERMAKIQGHSIHKAQNDFPKLKLNVVKKKLAGYHPTRTTLAEIDHALKPRHREVILKKREEMLLGPRGSLRRDLKSKKIVSTEEQVDCLLETSTDASILRCMYKGWSPLS